MGLLSSIFGSDKSTQTTSTTSSTSNSSDVYTLTDSHNLATNTTTNETSNITDTVTQDRRSVVDHGIGVSADNSTVFTQDSGNSWSQTNDTTNYMTTDFGAISGGVELGLGALKSNTELGLRTIDASKWLGSTASEMLRANLDYSQHVTAGSQAEARNAIREVVAASGNALSQVSAIAAKPLNANDPQRLVIIVALGVVGLVFFSKLKG